jgi:hypothetical protein
MTYRKVTIELVVHEDNCEGTIQQLSEDLERLQEHTTIFCADIRDETTDTPENAEEIAAGWDGLSGGHRQARRDPTSARARHSLPQTPLLIDLYPDWLRCIVDRYFTIDMRRTAKHRFRSATSHLLLPCWWQWEERISNLLVSHLVKLVPDST